MADTIDRYVRKRQLEWAQTINTRNKIYLDTRFWIPGGPFDDQVDAFNLVLRAVRQGLKTLMKVKYKKQPSLSAYPGPRHPFNLG